MTAADVETRGLSEAELVSMRESLAAGRKPRVQFTDSAGQIAGQIGQVVRLLDPADGDEFVVVKFGRDELPFSPGDVRVAPKGAVTRKPPQPAPVPEPAAVAPAGPPLLPPEPAARVAPGPAQRRGEDETARNGKDDEVTAPAARKAARPAKSKPAAALTVTLAYAEGEWTVGAMQGAKALARPYVIRPAEALRMVALIDVPGVQEAVEQIVASERAEARQQAERLRAELAEVEARLAELGEAGRDER